MRSPSRWRSEAAAPLLLLTALGATACDGGSSTSAPATVARVGGLPLHEDVVEHLVARDDLSPEQARARAVDTLRLVAAARARAEERGQPLGLRAQRETHLHRTALARLWLRERFEPSHGPADIPDDHLLLQRARQDPRLVHPELYVVCQVIVEPPGVDDLEAKAEITADPAWREAATALMDPLRERVERYVPIGDPDTCSLMSTQVTLWGDPTDPRLALSVSRPGGFDLDACMERDDDGRCVQPQFAPEWTEVVRGLDAPTLSEPFFSRFGLHLVYVAEHLLPQPADDPATEAAVRRAVLEPWRAEVLDRTLDEMGRARAVRMIRPTEDES